MIKLPSIALLLQHATTIMQTLSLQKQLIKSTLIISLLVGLIGFVVVGVVVIINHNQLFDDLLSGNAKALLDKDAHTQIAQSLRHVNDEIDIEYQVLDTHGTIISATTHAPQQPYLTQFDHDNYDNIYHEGQFWRIYTADNGDYSVQIAQPWSERIDYAIPILANYLGLILVFLLVLVLGNAWVIRRSLKPLTELKEEIGQKHLQDLSPIQPKVSLQETKPLINAINQLFARLILAKESQERFVADASHELRTPLSAIQMKLQLMQRKFTTQADIAQEISELQTDVKRTTALVESLLTLTRLDAHSDKPKENLAIVACLDEVVGIMQAIFWQAQATLKPCYRENTALNHLYIAVNKDLLFIALRNLLENALKYGGQGVVVEIHAHQEHQQLILSIKDNGAGVADTDLPRLSQRFFRVLGSQKTGAGLGLSIVSKIADYHDGQLWFDKGINQQGLGVFFSLALS